MSTERPRRARGLTLIELAIFIVVVGAGTAGVLSVLNLTVTHSADPFPVKQSLSVAEAMLDEVLAKSYAPLPGLPGAAGSGIRNATDDVLDYAGFWMMGVKAVDGTALAGLGNYRVDVAVGGAVLNGLAARLVTVTVTYPAAGGPGSQAYQLSGYRTDY